jgi:DegV family protein with EDD domain
MRVGIAIDVSTDVSDEFVKANDIYVLPSTLHMGDKSVVYGRDPEMGLAFYRDYNKDHGHATETTPFSVQEIEDLFLKKLVLEYDYVFLITLSSTRSLTYENAYKASFTILQSYMQAREARQIVGTFTLRVVDSQSLFTGPGVLAWETVRMVREKFTPVDIRKRLDELAPLVYAYVVPNDLFYLRARAARRGDSSVGWLSSMLSGALGIKPIIRANRSETRPVARQRHFGKAVEKLFLHCAAQIRRGLLVPMVGVSFGGDPEKLHAMDGFAELEQAAAENNVELMLSMMAPAAAINIGVGAVTLAYCARDAAEFEN